MTGTPADDSGPPGPEPVDSLTEEAARLLAVLAGLARDQGAGVAAGLADLGDRAAEAALDVDQHSHRAATGSEECTYCPVCRLISVGRRTSPEVRAHLATAASSLLQAAAGLLATHVPGPTGDVADDPGVERIDLDGDVDTVGPDDHRDHGEPDDPWADPEGGS